MSLRLLLLVVSSLPAVLAVARLAELKSDLTILTENDLLYNQTTKTTGGILLSAATSFEAAQKSCSSLGETLWSPEIQDFNLGLNSSLSYQIYLGNYSKKQLFWISSSKSCRGTDAYGHISTINCSENLPAVCTQTAPLSNITFADISSPFQVIVKAGDQTLTGYRDFHSFRFLGVRYAAQPERFAYSSVFTGTENSTALSPPPDCAQLPGTGSEDCLFLNLWTPFLPSAPTPKITIPKRKLKAVLVWIFGGGFVGGSASDPGGDSGNFASRGDAVAISLNYRLGNLGMLALNDGVTNGNFGIGDMITALQWIQKNIANFGGDPDRVTIMGQSSGAAAVRALLASELAKDLFHGAVMHSNPAGLTLFGLYSEYQTIEEEVKSVARQILNTTGCLNATSQVECLRGVDVNTLVNLPSIAGYPVIDGHILTTSGLSFTTNSSSKPKPLLLGTVRDEQAVTVEYPAPSNLTLAMQDLSKLIQVDLTNLTTNPAFTPFIPKNPTSDQVFNFTQMVLTLGGIKCLTLATAYSAALPHSQPLFDTSNIYLFEFNRTYQPSSLDRPICNPASTTQYPDGNPQEEEYYKCHAGDVIYPFGNVLRQGFVDRDGHDVAFSRDVLDQWAVFARTGGVEVEKGYREARGFEVEAENKNRWKTVGRSNGVIGNMMQWGGDEGMVDFESEAKKRCEVLGLGIDYYET